MKQDVSADSKKGATLRDVALHARVSLATASRAVSGGGYVSAATRRRVQSAMRELGYKPHAAARSLKLQRTNTIGLIITDIVNPFYAQVASGVLDAARRLGYHVILSATDEDAVLEREYLEVLMEKRVDGILAVPTERNVRQWKEARALGIRIVLIDRDVAGLSDADVVLVDNVKGSHDATAHLIELGHRRIGFIGGPTTTTTGEGRLHGYLAALRDAGIAVDQDLVRIGTFKRQSGSEMAQQLLALDHPPSAVFATNNVLGESALFTIREHGLSVPDHISFIMFDDVPWASLTTPALTVVAQPTYRLGVMAVEQLIQHLHETEKVQHRRVVAVLQPELVVRASSAPCPPTALVAGHR